MNFLLSNRWISSKIINKHSLTTRLMATRHTGLLRLLLVWKWLPLLSWMYLSITKERRPHCLIVRDWHQNLMFTTNASKLPCSCWKYLDMMLYLRKLSAEIDKYSSTQQENRPRNARLRYQYLFSESHSNGFLLLRSSLTFWEIAKI